MTERGSETDPSSMHAAVTGVIDRTEGAEDEKGNSTETVLQLLADAAAREILAATRDNPSTVTELIEECKIPSPTAYRKVNALAKVGLLEKKTRIRTHGKNVNEYTRRFETVHVRVNENGNPAISYSVTDSKPSHRQLRPFTDGGTPDGPDDSSQEQLRELFLDIAGTHEIVERQDDESGSRMRDGVQDLSNYVTATATEDGLADSLPEPDNDGSGGQEIS